MASAEYIINQETCVICLLTEEESYGLISNSNCNCKYSYHDKCMKNIPTCPYCKILFTAVTVVTVPTAPIHHVQQNHIDTTDSFCFKAVFTIIVVATLATVGYFSAIA
jgi:hypothetical protein